MLDFLKSYCLENQRVLLRPLKKQDLGQLSKIADDETIWQFLFEKGDTKEGLKAYVEEALEERSIQTSYPFLVFDKIKNKTAGTTRLYDFNQEFKIIKLGHTWLGQEFRGTYLNKHCKFLLFQFIFDTLGLERVGFGVHSENLRSIHALQSVGCKIEGRLESFMPATTEAKRADVVLLRLLKNEWHAEVRSELTTLLT